MWSTIIHKSRYLMVVIVAIAISSCENRDVNHADGPNFSEIHEDIQYHFDEIDLNGLKYYILERDRNNPHEGFGFMAMKADESVANQDSIKAYLKTLLYIQVQLLASQNGRSVEEVQSMIDDLFLDNLQKSKTAKIKEAEE